MQIVDLSQLLGGTELEADLAIIGGGPAGLTIARQFFNSPFEVIVLESGKLEEHPEFSALNQVESIGEPKGSAQAAKRIDFHGSQSDHGPTKRSLTA